MKYIIMIALAISSESLALCLPSQTATSFKCVKFIRAHDGDTFTVDIDNAPPLFGKKISVRIKGIDTPEMSGCLKDKAIAAKLFLEKTVKGANQIDLVNVGRDKYFRILANVSVDGLDLGSMLINQKLAHTYDGGQKESWFCK